MIHTEVVPQITFEEELAYFFGVADSQPVKEMYLSALEKLSLGNNNSISKQEALEFLQKAYQSVADQNEWNFDISKAAELELQIILGHQKGIAVQDIEQLMRQLYTVVFQMDSPQIVKAAKLRTFLYQYKLTQELSPEDKTLLLEISNHSKFLLNSLKRGF